MNTLNGYSKSTLTDKYVLTASGGHRPLADSEFIVGTQTAATGSWTGVSIDSELYDGKQITYWLPYNGSGNATLNLTLAGGSTTGAVNCYYGGTSRLTTHYGAGNIIRLVYRKNVNISGTTYTGWWADANYTDTLSGYVTSSTASLSSYWGKLWDVTRTAMHDDLDITFYIHSAYNVRRGFVHIRVRRNKSTTNNVTTYSHLVFMQQISGNIPSSSIRLYHDATSGKMELWVNIEVQYGVYNATIISCTDRVGKEVIPAYGTLYTNAFTTVQTLPSYDYISLSNAESDQIRVTQHTLNSTEYPLVWSNQPNTNNIIAAQLYKSYNHLTYNPSLQRITVKSINSNLVTNTHLAGNQGTAIINSTATAGAYTMLAKMNSTNGYFTQGIYGTNYNLYYTNKSVVDAGTNATSYYVTLLGEDGDSKFPGHIYTNNKKVYDDGKNGIVLGSETVHICGSTPTILFYSKQSTAATAAMYNINNVIHFNSPVSGSKASVMQINVPGVSKNIDWGLSVTSVNTAGVNDVGSGVGIVLGGYSRGNFDSIIGRGAGIAAVTEDGWYNHTGIAFYVNDTPSNTSDSFSEKMRLSHGGHLIPKFNTTQTLGTSNSRWSNIYSTSGNFSGQITSTVTTGTAPFAISSTTKVTNLNADLLDGYHESSFLRYRGELKSNVNFNDYYNGSYVNVTGNGSGNSNNPTSYGYLLTFPGAGSNSYYAGWQFSASTTRLQFRSHWDYAWGNWITVITDQNISLQSVSYATTAGTADSVAWANVTGKPDFSNYVTLDGTQTITGPKTFTNNIYINSSYSITDSSGNGILGVYPKTWTGVPSDGSAIGLGTISAPLYIRTSEDNLYHYRNNTSQSYTILDSGNWSSYITLPTIPNISITDSGSGNAVTSITASGHTLTVTKGSTFATSSHTHYYLTTPGDKRSEATTPSSYSNTFVFQGLKNNSAIDSPSSVAYSYLLGLRGWSDSSGGNSWELAFNNTGIYARNGASTWGSWGKIAFISDIPTKTSQLTNDSNFITSRGYIGTTPVQGSQAAQSLSGIVDIVATGNYTSAVSTSTSLYLKLANKDTAIGLRADSGTVRGVYDYGKSKWLVYSDGTDGTVLQGHVSTSSTWSKSSGGAGIKILNAIGSSPTGALSSYSIGLEVSGYYSLQLASKAGVDDTLYFKGAQSTGWVEILHKNNLGNTAILYDGDIDTTITHLGRAGYGYAANGWKTSGPAIAIGSTNGYTALIQQLAGNPTLYVSYKSNGGAVQDWNQIAFISDLTWANITDKPTIPTIYERNICINSNNWTVYGPNDTDSTRIYAPTSVGTSGQVLTSNGSGAPSWTNQSNLSVGSAVNAGFANQAGSADYADIAGGCSYGTFGNAATKSYTSTVSSTSDALITSSGVDAAIAKYLPLAGGTMTGAISFNDISTKRLSPMIKFGSNNQDTILWKVYSSESTYADKGVYGFDMTYKGTGSADGNHLILHADNQNASTKVAAMTITQAGVVSFAKTVSCDISGNAATATTATTANKLGTGNKGSATKPIYLNAGTPAECSTYAGGTAVTLNGTSKSGSTASFYSPITAGTSGQVLVSSGSGAPSWQTLSIKDTNISWSTTSIQGNLSIMEMAYSNVHSSNKLAFGKVAGVTLEYSRNGGSSWTALTGDSWDIVKLNLISGISASVSTGNRTTGNTANDKLRITLNAVAMGIYTWPRKLLINITSSVTAKPYATVQVEYSTIGSPTSYTVYDTYNISGWSGWNSIPLTSLSTFGGGSNQTSNVQNIRLTFANNNANKYLTILDIYMIGQTNWWNPSNMSKTGHLYNYNYNQDMILPSSLSLGGTNNYNKKIDYLANEGYLYVTANNISSSKTGGIIMKTTKNSVISQVLLQSDSDYGKVKITGDLCIGGRASNPTAFISSDAIYNIYLSVGNKDLLVCNSNEGSVRGSSSQASNTDLGTTNYPWKAVYSKQLCLKSSWYTNTINPASGDYTYNLPSTSGTLMVADMVTDMIRNYAPKYAIYEFSYSSSSSTYTLTRIGGNGQFFKLDASSSNPYYQKKWTHEGIFIHASDAAWEGRGSIIIFGSGPSINEGAFVSGNRVSGFYPNHVVICESSQAGLNGTNDYGYAVRCVDLLGNYQSSGSGRIYCIGQY